MEIKSSLSLHCWFPLPSVTVRGPCRGSGGQSPASHRAAQVGFQISPCGICGGRSVAATAFSSIISVSSCQYHSTNASYSFLSTCCSYQTDKRAKPGNLNTNWYLLEIGEHLESKIFCFLWVGEGRRVKWILTFRSVRRISFFFSCGQPKRGGPYKLRHWERGANNVP